MSKYILDKKAKGRGGEWNGGDVTWTGEDVNSHIEKWMKSMGLLVPESCLLYTSPSPRDNR